MLEPIRELFDLSNNPGPYQADLAVGTVVAGVAAWGDIRKLRDTHGGHQKAVHQDDAKA